MNRGIGILLMGAGYGVAWFVAVLNTFVVLNRISQGLPLDSFLPMALAAWGIILYVHYRAKWFPFRSHRG